MWKEENGGGRGASVRSGLPRTGVGGKRRGASTGPERRGNDSHLQKPREALAAAASRLLSVSVTVRSVDMEETSLVGDVDPRCWLLLLTAAPVL